MVLVSIICKAFYAFVTVFFFPLIPQKQKIHTKIFQAFVPAAMFGATSLFPEWRLRTIFTILVVLLWVLVAARNRKSEPWKSLCLITGAVWISIAVYCAAVVLCYPVQFLFKPSPILMQILRTPIYLLIFLCLQHKNIFMNVIRLSGNSVYASIFLCGTALSFLMYSILCIAHELSSRIMAVMALLIIELSKLLLLRLFQSATTIKHPDKHDSEVINHRLNEVERYALSSNRVDSELAHELSAVKIEVDEIAQRNNERGRAALLASGPLPSTGIPLLNSHLQIFQGQCVMAGIESTVFVETDLRSMSKKEHVPMEVLRRIVETLSDNALEAFSGSHTSADAIHIIIGYKDGYCIEVLDNAPPFPLKVLRNIGAECNTLGGNGSGIPDLIDAITPYKASFILEELSESRSQLTKSIMVRFDGRSQRLVLTKRSLLLRQQDNMQGFHFVDRSESTKI